jgi:predicted unusual protein kinase regulating ubiquinone biosynthesis (AarF/ABC1/UbiB family)
VMYDFGQAATLTQGQADGILSIIEAIIDQDVEKSIEAFQTMNVLVDGANLDLVRKKVAENYRLGKVKANKKTLKRRGYISKKNSEETPSSTKPNTLDVTKDPSPTKSKKETRQDDLEVMSFFTLPAEYAFVGRAISQMDGVGKSLDPDFDFISNSAPYIVEIEGASKYLKEQAIKIVLDFQKKIVSFQKNLMKKETE